MKRSVDLGEYTPENGLVLKWVPDYEVSADFQFGVITIHANREGCLALAQHFATLAEAHVPSGTHAHLDPGLMLDDDSLPLVLDRRDR